MIELFQDLFQELIQELFQDPLQKLFPELLQELFQESWARGRPTRPSRQQRSVFSQNHTMTNFDTKKRPTPL